MGMQKFRAPRLPNPADEYDRQQIHALLRSLEVYFSQLDSDTAIQAEGFYYPADPNTGVESTTVDVVAKRYALLVG